MPETGKPIKTTLDFLKTVEEDVYVISGSTLEKQKLYEDRLANLNVVYKKLFLSKEDHQTDVYYKLAIALSIPNLTLAIDNNKKVVAAYRKSGINAIFPHDLIQYGHEQIPL